MPKIKNVDYWVGKVKNTTAVNYSTKENEFYLSLPKEMFSIAKAFVNKKDEEIEKEAEQEGRKNRHSYGGVSEGRCRLEAGNMDGLMALLKEYVAFYEEMNTQKRKVIVADFKYHSKDVEPSGGGIVQDGGYAELRFNYYVLWEYNIGNKRTFFPIDHEGENLPYSVRSRQMPNSINHRPSDYKIIPYTDEGLKFMANFYDHMNGLMKKIGQFCGSEEKLMLTIEKGMKMLNA